MKFIHLHNHSDYSILDGGITIDRLIARAKDLGMPGVAITDHGNMFGAIEFYQKAKKAGIKPIIGQEFYMSPGSRFKKESAKAEGGENAYHLILLAKNEAGYRNLLKLSSIGYTEGFYYKPRIDMEVLEKYSQGLICSTACIAGQIPVHILKGENSMAIEMAGRLNEIFGRDNFYLEMQYHNIQEQAVVNKELIKMSSALGIPLIATNDAHYLTREDSFSHEVLLCIQTGKTLEDKTRMKFSSDEFYVKTTEEMAALFPDNPEALANTVKIYEMTDLALDLNNVVLPHFDVPQGYDLNTYLKKLVFEGAATLYGKNLPIHVVERIEYEISVIVNMKFSGYFLIVWDFIKQARKMSIAVGPGRGSAAGSIVSYCLGITALDPLKYNLLFERFLNPDRNEMPDMDLDFCADRREEVIDYVRKKYGDNHVSQIITFNKMTSKAVVKDVARVLNIPFAKANDISKLIEKETLKESIDSSPELKKLYKDEEVGHRLIDISLKLEGLIRSAGKHAAGVVISRGPLWDYVPLYRDSKEGTISSQYDKNTLEKAGLVKMDFLGLRNLTIIEKCVGLIKENAGIDLDITTIPLDDKKTYRLLQRGDTKGVFQLEKSGMQNLLKRIAPTSFEEIIAIVALYRPGPLKSGMADDFVARKKNTSLVAYPHPSLEPILKDTLGVVIYQEQVMLISQVMGGFTLPEADKLRKAMGKKNMDIINSLEAKFLAGAEKNKIGRELASKVYRMIEKFGEYGFNKSHSAAYALVSYQTAYLKANYPLQYMTALLSAQPDNQDDVVQYTNDSRAAGINVLPPSINESLFDFSIEGSSIRYGLGAIKGLGKKAIEDIVSARMKIKKFSSFRDFLETTGSLSINRGVLESLIKSGAFDALYPNRAALFNSIDILIDTAKKMQEDRLSGQGNLFSPAPGSGERDGLDIADFADWTDKIKLGFEKEALGMYISGHPLMKYENEIKALSSVNLSNLTEELKGKDVTIIGIVRDFEIKRSQKNNNRYGTGILEDLYGTIEIIIFSSVLKKYEDMLSSDEPLAVTGTFEFDDDRPKKIIVTSVKSLREFRRQAISALHIKLDSPEIDEDMLNTLKSAFLRNRGDCPIFFHVNEEKGEKIIKAHSTFNISPSESLVKDISEILGGESIRYTVGNL